MVARSPTTVFAIVSQLGIRPVDSSKHNNQHVVAVDGGSSAAELRADRTGEDSPSSFDGEAPVEKSGLAMDATRLRIILVTSVVSDLAVLVAFSICCTVTRIYTEKRDWVLLGRPKISRPTASEAVGSEEQQIHQSSGGSGGRGKSTKEVGSKAGTSGVGAEKGGLSRVAKNGEGGGSGAVVPEGREKDVAEVPVSRGEGGPVSRGEGPPVSRENRGGGGKNRGDGGDGGGKRESGGGGGAGAESTVQTTRKRADHHPPKPPPPPPEEKGVVPVSRVIAGPKPKPSPKPKNGVATSQDRQDKQVDEKDSIVPDRQNVPAMKSMFVGGSSSPFHNPGLVAPSSGSYYEEPPDGEGPLTASYSLTSDLFDRLWGEVPAHKHRPHIEPPPKWHPRPLFGVLSSGNDNLDIGMRVAADLTAGIGGSLLVGLVAGMFFRRVYNLAFFSRHRAAPEGRGHRRRRATDPAVQREPPPIVQRVVTSAESAREAEGDGAVRSSREEEGGVVQDPPHGSADRFAYVAVSSEERVVVDYDMSGSATEQSETEASSSPAISAKIRPPPSIIYQGIASRLAGPGAAYIAPPDNWELSSDPGVEPLRQRRGRSTSRVRSASASAAGTTDDQVLPPFRTTAGTSLTRNDQDRVVSSEAGTKFQPFLKTEEPLSSPKSDLSHSPPIITAPSAPLFKAGIFLLFVWAVYSVCGMLSKSTAGDLRLEPLLICSILACYVGHDPGIRSEVAAVIHTFTPHIFLPFFTVTGASLEVSALVQTGPTAILVFFLRLVAVWISAGVGVAIAERLGVSGGGGGGGGGGATTTSPRGGGKEMRLYLGSTLLSQAGIALGLALEVVNVFPNWGQQLADVVIAVVCLNQIFGPVFCVWGMHRLAVGAPVR